MATKHGRLLHKAGIVPKNYDKEAYKKDLDAHAKNQPTTVDFSNAEMQSCWVANGASVRGRQ